MLLMIDCKSEYILELKKVLNDIGAEFKSEDWDKLDELDFDEFSGIIISGSSMMLSEQKESFLTKFSFIETYEKPILGICFGHQIIGCVFGAEISKCEHIFAKLKIDLLKPDSLFENITNFSFQQGHDEQVGLPKNFYHIASSSHTQVEGIKHKDKPIWGVQFHPEASGEQGLTLLSNFHNICASYLLSIKAQEVQSQKD